jgi:hypothetical protein
MDVVLFDFMTMRRRSAGCSPAMTRGHGPGRPAGRRGPARLRAGSGALIRSGTETAANAGLLPDRSYASPVAPRLIVGNILVIVLGALTYLLLRDIAHWQPDAISAACGCVIAAVLVVGMLFEGWPAARLPPAPRQPPPRLVS